MSKINIDTPQKDEISPAGPTGAERRQQLILVAYQLIAEKGFEGLRTRAVAERVGINHATLHYHFPTKEDLIQGVVDYLIQQFSAPHAVLHPAQASSLELVRAEFSQINQLHQVPEMIIVLDELSLRALRDPAIAKLLNEMDKGWHSYLSELLRSGVRQGAFRVDLDVDLGAMVIMTMIKGIRADVIGKSQPRTERISALLLAQLECWLID